MLLVFRSLLRSSPSSWPWYHLRQLWREEEIFTVQTLSNIIRVQTRHAWMKPCLRARTCVLARCVRHISWIIRWDADVNLKKNELFFRLWCPRCCCLCVIGWRGGNSKAKVIRPERSSCLEGAGRRVQGVYCTLPPPLIKNEWWAVWVKDRNGVLCPGDAHRASVSPLLDTPQTAVYNPQVTINRPIKLCSIQQ